MHNSIDMNIVLYILLAIFIREEILD